MKQIKTVVRPIEYAHEYDKEINSLLADGWILKKRMITNMSGEISEAFNSPIILSLYAELERNVPPYPEEITL